MVYNSLTEICFKSCVDVINSRKLEPHEIKCVDECSQKFIKLNHRFMGAYVKYQQVRTQKLIDDANKEPIKLSETEDVNLNSDTTLVESTNVE